MTGALDEVKGRKSVRVLISDLLGSTLPRASQY